jgi:hypothetical protein
MEGNMAGLCRKLAGSENPKKKLRFFLRELAGEGSGASWLMQKIGWTNCHEEDDN